MNWRAILAIVRKDVVEAVKNRYILFGLALPLALSLFFRLVVPRPDETGRLTVVAYDPGGSRLVAELRVRPDVQVVEVTADQELAEEVEQSRAAGGLAVPVGFDAALEAGQWPELTAYLNRRRGGGEQARFQRLVDGQVWALVGQRPPVRVIWVDAAAPAGSPLGGGFPLQRFMLVTFLVVGLAMAGAFVVPTLLVEEKQKHTLDALLLSPARPREVIAGKALTGLFYSALVVGVLMTLNRGWVGDWPVTLLAALLGALFMVAVGVLIGSLCRTVTQVNTWSNVVALVLIVPSWVTLAEVPRALEVAFSAIPTYYLMKALDLALAGEASLPRVWGDLAVLCGSVVVVLVAVVWRLRRWER